jgi:hypothetical protein
MARQTEQQRKSQERRNRDSLLASIIIENYGHNGNKATVKYTNDGSAVFGHRMSDGSIQKFPVLGGDGEYLRNPNSIFGLKIPGHTETREWGDSTDPVSYTRRQVHDDVMNQTKLDKLLIKGSSYSKDYLEEIKKNIRNHRQVFTGKTW